MEDHKTKVRHEIEALIDGGRLSTKRRKKQVIPSIQKPFKFAEVHELWPVIYGELLKHGRVKYSTLWPMLEEKTIRTVNVCYGLLMTDGRGGFIAGEYSIDDVANMARRAGWRESAGGRQKYARRCGKCGRMMPKGGNCCE